MRSRITSKVIFAGCVGYFDRAYIRGLSGTKSDSSRFNYMRLLGVDMSERVSAVYHDARSCTSFSGGNDVGDMLLSHKNMLAQNVEQ